MTSANLFHRVRNALEHAHVPYMLTGSIASSVHGTPRATHNVDIVIAPDHDSLSVLLDSFSESEYYVSREAALAALSSEGQFNVIDFNTGWKIDFIIFKSTPFGRDAFARRLTMELEGIPLSIASAEDVLVSKLDWARRASSERQLDDVAGIILEQGASLDTAYVEHWVTLLGLTSQWNAAKARAI